MELTYTHVFIAVQLEGDATNPRNVEIMDEVNAVLQTIVLKPGEHVTTDIKVEVERLGL